VDPQKQKGIQGALAIAIVDEPVDHLNKVFMVCPVSLYR
jgi:hypothetical protein